jgi:hypothetical protein
MAVSLGAGGFFVAQAAPGPSESTIVTVSPERILDTRDPNNVGLAGPFVSAVSQKLQVTGSIPTATGTKTVVPTGATGVLLNVTPVNPTANGFISIRPGDATGAATTSSLNFTTGVAGIVPNAVQVAMPTAGANEGEIDITYDAYGVAGPTTDILIDVVGYMTSAGLQELVADVAAKANAADVYTKAQVDAAIVARAPIARSAREGNVSPNPDGMAMTLVSVTINAPVAGLLQMVGSTWILGVGGTERTVDCWLDVGGTKLGDTDRSDFVALGNQGSCSTNGARPVAAGTHVVNLRSDAAIGVDLDDTTLDVIFIPGGTETATESGPTVDEASKP